MDIENKLPFKSINKKEMTLYLDSIMKDMINYDIRCDMDDINNIVQNNNLFYIWSYTTLNRTNSIKELTSNFIESCTKKYNTEANIKSMIIVWSFSSYVSFIDIVDASELINDSMQNNIEILYAVKFDITNIKHESSLTIIAF